MANQKLSRELEVGERICEMQEGNIVTIHEITRVTVNLAFSGKYKFNRELVDGVPVALADDIEEGHSFQMETLTQARELRKEQELVALYAHDPIGRMCVELITELKDERLTKGIGMYNMALLTGMQQPNLTRFETCKILPTMKTFVTIADKLGFTVKLEKH